MITLKRKSQDYLPNTYLNMNLHFLMVQINLHFFILFHLVDFPCVFLDLCFDLLSRFLLSSCELGSEQFVNFRSICLISFILGIFSLLTKASMALRDTISSEMVCGDCSRDKIISRYLDRKMR